MRELYLYEVEPDYLRFLHKLDSRVSVKFNNRPFVGLIVMINGALYILPLTSQTTEKRALEGKKKRSAKATTFIRDSSGKEIAEILHNNMIPVIEGTYSLKKIDADKDTYELNEIRFIRKNQEMIISKAKRIHDWRVDNKDSFLVKICCDFSLLELKCREYRAKE